MKLAKMKVFSAFDSKLEVWTTPMFFLHTGQAERTWIELCSDPASMLAKHPVDYTLFQIGEFDDATGSLSALQPVQVMTALAGKEAREPRQMDLPKRQ